MPPPAEKSNPPRSSPAQKSQSQSEKPQVLSPQQAHSLAQQDAVQLSSPGRNGAREPKPPGVLTSSPLPSAQEPPRPPQASSTFTPSSFLKRLRARYSKLPAPVRRTCRVLRVVAPVIPIGIFFSEHVLQVMWVRGPSMTPYLNENYAETQTQSDMVLVNMWPWGSWPWQTRRRLERGMVVTFRSPANPSHIAIKRVIALPGDRVTTREPCPRPSQIVPFNHVWLEGDADDPRKSLDSNTYGPVSISLITGRVLGVVWPRMRRLKWWEWDESQESDSKSQTGRQTPTDYRQAVRGRVLKEAVEVESPYLE